MLQEIGQLATAAGVFLAYFSLRAARRQRLRQFETIYVQRYWALMDGLSVDAVAGRYGDVRDSDEKIARSYIRLCEDELELRREGWISNATWRIWSTGIDAQMRRWPFSAVWRQILEDSAPVPAQQREFQYLRNFMQDKADPQGALSRAKRLARTLRPSP